MSVNKLFPPKKPTHKVGPMSWLIEFLKCKNEPLASSSDRISRLKRNLSTELMRQPAYESAGSVRSSFRCSVVHLIATRPFILTHTHLSSNSYPYQQPSSRLSRRRRRYRLLQSTTNTTTTTTKTFINWRAFTCVLIT